jgi:UDPglucose--hexose-1-phosphate uridylyltransferase
MESPQRLALKKRRICAEYESPFDGFQKVRVSGEIRECPLSGHVTRILPYRIKEFARIDLAPLIERSREAGCPFCPEAIEIKTPRFLPGFAEGSGRIVVGETTLFPNAFPYDEWSAVAVISREHFLALGDFQPQLFANGLRACRIYLEKTLEFSPGAPYALVNWNYLPMAGAGLVHPHLQVAAFPEPTVYQRSIIERQREYEKRGGGSLVADLLAVERADSARYIAALGKWHWLMAYAPRGVYEFWAISGDPGDILRAEEKDLRDLAQGICLILRYLDGKGVQALNLSWYSFLSPEDHALRDMLSILPRVSFPPFGTSDINYFDRLQGESISFVLPEALTPEVRALFPKKD